MDIRKLKELEGKKLLWAGQDEDSGIYYLFFEGMAGVSSAEFITLPDNAAHIAQSLVEGKIQSAQSILALKVILDSITPTEAPHVTAQPGVLETPDPANPPPPGGGGENPQG